MFKQQYMTKSGSPRTDIVNSDKGEGTPDFIYILPPYKLKTVTYVSCNKSALKYDITEFVILKL